MAQPAEIAQLERDFLTGKNPLAYIPLCQALRRGQHFSRALDICQRGLAHDPDSIAGRTLHARLLADLGHYEDALREISKAELSAPDAVGLQIEKARCLLRLQRNGEASSVLDKLNTSSPMNPEVQNLNRQLRDRERANSRQSLSSVSVERLPRVFRRNCQEVLNSVIDEMHSMVKVVSAAVIPTGAGEPAVEGDAMHAEAAYEFYRGISIACKDLESGQMRVGLMETDQIQLIVLVRDKTIVSISFEPTPNFGKIYHRLVTVVGQLMPEAK